MLTYSRGEASLRNSVGGGGTGGTGGGGGGGGGWGVYGPALQIVTRVCGCQVHFFQMLPNTLIPPGLACSTALRFGNTCPQSAPPLLPKAHL